MYVFTSQYTGSPSELAQSTSYIAKSDNAADGQHWVFPSSYQFSAGVKYYAYADRPFPNLSLRVAAGTSKRDVNGRSYSESSGGAYQESPDALNYEVRLRDQVDGTEHGDPIFIGFNNQKFRFSGAVGSIYNVYNDEWVVVNGLFGIASSTNANSPGRVVTEFGILIGGHSISIRVEDFLTNIAHIQIDGEITSVRSTVKHFSNCVDINYNSKRLYISTPMHTFYITRREGVSYLADMPELDFNMHHPVEDITKIGGVLGQTASSGQITTDQSSFKVSTIFSTENSENYKGSKLMCDSE